jgi:hypothetical protein
MVDKLASSGNRELRMPAALSAAFRLTFNDALEEMYLAETGKPKASNWDLDRTAIKSRPFALARNRSKQTKQQKK